MPPTLLHAFRHPLLWASILVLLLNDHVLKTLAPSWLTGKLSDFAGLFFFPFLVGAALHPVLVFCQEALAGLVRRLRPAAAPLPRAAAPWTSRLALLLSFGLCAALFAALKTLPAANALAAGLLSQFYNIPIRIALDPSDLLALLVFLPAWALWRRLEQASHLAGARSGQHPASAERWGGPAPRRTSPPGLPHPAPDRLAYAALGLGVLASLATSPCPSTASIQRLAVLDSSLYAATLSDRSGGYTSLDQGRSWTYLAELPLAAAQAMAQPPALPLTRCDPAAALTCYRITGLPQVEESRDGGQTWRIAWQVPPGREGYIRRAASGYGLILGSCGKFVELQPFDLTFVPGPGGSTAVVAMGNEGLLLRSPGASDWQRAALQLAQDSSSYYSKTGPTPFAARSLDEALRTTQPEWLSALGLAALAALALSLWAWSAAALHPAPGAAHPGRWIFRPLRWLVIWTALLAAGYFLQGMGGPGQISYQLRNLLSPILLLASAAFPFGILLFSVLLWRRAASLVAQPARFGRLAWLAVLGGAAPAAADTLMFLLWAAGVLVTYELAQAAAVLAGLAVLAAVILRLQRGMTAALN